MPSAFAMDKMNSILTKEMVAGVDPENIGRLRRGESFIDLSMEFTGLSEDDVSYLKAIPPVLQEGVRGALAQALSDGQAVHLQYSPGYDFSIQLWDYGEGVSIHLSGPYPPGTAPDRFAPPAKSPRKRAARKGAARKGAARKRG